MEINVTGRKMNVGEALTDHIKTRLSGVADKYFSRSIDSSATVTKEGHICRVDISMHPNQGIQLHGRGEADDPYAAFDIAADKVEKQLRRYKRRLKNHHTSPSKEIAVELARENVLAPEHEDDESSDVPDQPLIIAETKKEIPSVSVGDAVMLMDLADSSAFVFRNVKGDGLEVVYRRKDGNIGWITPSN
ncbi:ribosomal subunit interface protein [Kordiimonas sediminis]|uniref:Ribosome hibernation promoting factor n=1 Tax=Kordiimonas sediminis TaxID=1735581 RepID=A0A919ALY8_9PROT|nr:ribosome-associated translation inhibitor RaiA [Kordiimonas sediminis]GHF15937.1 ribosomal subunit interface protein [Kordiimonas sediminis]